MCNFGLKIEKISFSLVPVHCELVLSPKPEGFWQVCWSGIVAGKLAHCCKIVHAIKQVVLVQCIEGQDCCLLLCHNISIVHHLHNKVKELVKD